MSLTLVTAFAAKSHYSGPPSIKLRPPLSLLLILILPCPLILLVIGTSEKQYTIRVIPILIKIGKINRIFDIQLFIVYIYIYMDKFGVKIFLLEVLARVRRLIVYTQRYLAVNFGTAPVSSNAKNGVLLFRSESSLTVVGNKSGR